MLYIFCRLFVQVRNKKKIDDCTFKYVCIVYCVFKLQLHDVTYFGRRKEAGRESVTV